MGHIGIKMSNIIFVGFLIIVGWVIVLGIYLFTASSYIDIEKELKDLSHLLDETDLSQM